MKNIITSTWDEVRFQPHWTSSYVSPFRQSLIFFCYMYSQMNLTSASATTITQPQTSAQSCSICAHHTWTRVRSDLFTRPTAATSSLQSSCLLLASPQSQSPFGRQVYSTQPKKKVLFFFFVSLSDICERMEQWGFIVKQRKREQGAHQSFFFFYQMCLYNPLPPRQSFLFSHTNTKGWSAEKTKTMWPCIIRSLSFSERHSSHFLFWNLESFIDK